jgi:hypothetical protein
VCRSKTAQCFTLPPSLFGEPVRMQLLYARRRKELGMTEISKERLFELVIPQPPRAKFQFVEHFAGNHLFHYYNPQSYT